MHWHHIEKQTISTSASQTIEEVLVQWQCMGKTTIEKRQAVVKLKTIYEKWMGLKKEAQLKPLRKSFPEKKSKLQHDFSLLFDLAPIRPVRTEVVDVRNPGQSRHPNQQQANNISIEVDDDESQNIGQDQYESYDNLLSDDDDTDPSDPDFSVRKRIKRQSGRKKKILSDKVCDALDRGKLSSGKAMFLLNSVIEATGQTPADYTFSKETIRKCRMLRREKLYMEIQNMFNGVEKFVVHWDSKACSNSKGEKEEKLSVAVSYGGLTKMLACPSITDKKGQTQAMAVLDALRSWGIEDKVVGMCFDTTSSNTGLNIGACVNIQNEIRMNILYLPCRHHIMELVVGCAFQTCKSLEESTVSEDILIFKRFKGAWKRIDRDRYDNALLDGELMDYFTRADIIKVKQFCNQQINTFHPRNDYKELLQLILTLFGEAKARGIANVDILAPGSVSRARWMAKIIYILKIYLFRAQFNLTDEQLVDIRRFICFVTKIYIYHWYSCSNGVVAARNDLQLIKEILEYRDIDEVIARAALKKISQHLWYLGEINIGFSFFDLSIEDETKQRMVNSLRHRSIDKNTRKFDIGINPGEQDMERFADMDVSHFVSKRTKDFFNVLNINLDFLTIPPSQWKTSATYMEQINILQKIHVVNDLAERGVSLAAEYSDIITKSDEQQQYLMHVVENHRATYPNAKKSTLNVNDG